MHKLEIKLKQHTPLIHFQHDQEGATLRASEVKPKLDKFILTKLGGGDYEKGKAEAKVKGWLVGKGDHPALDYKMTIESNGCHEFDERIVGDRKKAIKYDNTKLILYFRNDNFCKQLLESLCPFFIVNNFGLRQSKGYGSFSVISIEMDGVAQSINNDYDGVLNNYYDFVYKKTNVNNARTTIDNDYKILKSGDNPPNGNYRKSLLFCYAVTEMDGAPRWEKRFFKQKISPLIKTKGYFLKTNKNSQGKWNEPIKDSDGNQGWPDKPNRYNYAYVRGLLGIAEHFEFSLTKGAKAVVKIDGGDELQRFQSPIQFKVFDNIVYLVGKEPCDILGKKINLSYSIKEPNNGEGKSKYTETELTQEDPKAKSLTIPENFSLAKFMSYAIPTLNNYKKIKGI